MFKNSFVKIFIAAALMVSFSAQTFADIRIRFAKGRTSATMKGRIGSGGRVCYSAVARPGQYLTATVSSASGKVQIFESGETSYSYEVTDQGSQSICVDNLSRATTYTLTVSIR